MFKKQVKRLLLNKKGIVLDTKSNINFNCEHEGTVKSRIVNSIAHVNKMGEGCFVENAYIYGDVELGRFVSISGPGTIIHSEVNGIHIGSFSSIEPNVSIIEFNHDYNRPTSYAIQLNIFNNSPEDDFISKGPVEIGEDVWVGANVVILSGVKIGRGAVIAAGSVVDKDVEPYSIYGGVPARRIKMRFLPERINLIEDTKWWEWDVETIRKEKVFFEKI